MQSTTPAADAAARAVRPAWLAEATDARRAGDVARAEALARAHLDDGGTGDAYARGLLGRIALAAGRAEDAVGWLAISVRGHAASGSLDAEADDRFALAYVLSTYLHRFVEADRVLDERSEALESRPSAAAQLPYYRSVVAMAVGDHRRALSLLDAARARAEALPDPALAEDVEEAAATILSRVGRAREARDRLLALDARPGEIAPPCVRVTRLTNAALASQEAQSEAGSGAEIPRGEPVALLERALAMTASECRDAVRAANVGAELARARLAAGDGKGARRALAASRAAGASPTPWLEETWGDAEGGIALREGRADAALVTFTRQERAAAGDGSPAARWRALVGMARALAAQRRTREAEARYAEAEQALDDATLLVPLGEGRTAVAASFAASARERVALLLADGRPREAFDAARASRARVQRGVRTAAVVASLPPDERAAWDAAAAAFLAERDGIDADAARDRERDGRALAAARAARSERAMQARRALEMALTARLHVQPGPAPLAPGVADPDALTLLAHPLTDEWVLFAERGGRLRVHRLGPLDLAPARADSLARALLGPVEGELRTAGVVRFLPYGPLAAVDLHALPLDGAPLFTRVPVVYASDEPAAGTPPRDGALVVADPAGDLPGARREAAAVSASLARHGVAPLVLLAQAEATAARVREGLPRAGVFHFAGHGAFAGRDGLDSAVMLAAGGRLEVADVLALPSAPAFVVLSACDAGKSEATAAAEGFGIARAFIAAGSRAVLAPSRPVDDAIAGDVVAGLYAEGASTPEGLLRAAHAALRAIASKEPRADVAAFRLWVP